jgi:hypothetical protein
MLRYRISVLAAPTPQPTLERMAARTHLPPPTARPTSHQSLPVERGSARRSRSIQGVSVVGSAAVL